MKWFRCWTDIRTDPKMHDLDDSAFRIWIHLLSLVAEDGKSGMYVLASPRAMSKAMHTTERKWKAALETFLEKNMIEMRSPDTLAITNWLKRQPVSDSSQPRVTRYRALQKRPNGVTETPPETDTEADTDTDTEKTTTSRVWLKKITGKDPLNRVQREMLVNFDAAHPPDCLEWGWVLASDKEDPFRYVKAVFDTCPGEGHGPRKRNGTSEHVQANRGRVATGGLHPRAAAAKPWD